MPRLLTAGRFALLSFFLLVSLSAFAAGEVNDTVLPNGLRVLIKESHAAPAVVVDVWYKVGSRNERPGLTGCSHLLEHMTYRGTATFSKTAMHDLISKNGAIDNGATFYDYTHFHTTIASDRLLPVLTMEASRMSTALITQHDLDAERTVVLSELDGNANNPSDLLFQETMSAAFRAHPYHWPVVGWRTDLEHVDADTLRDYYHKYYMPNNATLVIVGDVNTARTLEQVRKTFGELKAGPAPAQWTTPEPTQYGERRVVVRHSGELPMEMIVWHTPDVNHADYPALKLLEQILSTGRLSRLNQQIVEKRIAVGTWASAFSLRDSGVFMVGGVVSPGQTLAPMEKAILDEVQRIQDVPPTAAEMARGVRQVEAAMIFGRDSITEQANDLGEAATEAGDWRHDDQVLAQMRKLTPADITRVAKTYCTVDNRTIGTFEPNGKPGGGIAPSGGELHHHMNDLPNPVAYYHGAPDAVYSLRVSPDATAPAAATGNATAQPNQRERIVLPNGMVVLVQENHVNPTIAVTATLHAGKAYDPAGKTGVADMVANLLDRGTATRTSNQIAEEMEGAAALLDTGTGWETATMRGKALSGDYALLLRNMADELRNASFPEEEMAKIREQMLSNVADEQNQPGEVARRAFYRAVLPAGNPYRLASFAEEQDGLKAITRADLLTYYRAHYVPSSMVLAIVGDVKIADVRAAIEKYFGDWQGATPAAMSFQPVEVVPAQHIVTRMPDKSEVEIYAGYASTLKRSDPDYYAAEVMNMILGGGGALNSRLGDVIREKHGLAYTLQSGFHASSGAGPWFAALGVNPKNVEQALTLLQTEITRMRDQGVTPDELRTAVDYITGAYAITLQSNAELAGALADAEYFHLGLDYPEHVAKLYHTVTRDQVNTAAHKYLQPDKLTVSIAGTYDGK